MDQININTFGYTDRFAAFAIEYPQWTIGRVLSQEKGLYRIISEHGEQLAETSGKFRFEAKSVSDYPAVGDFVMVDCMQGNNRAIIHHILPRKSAFIRKAAGTGHNEQVVAANIDKVFICMSLNNDFNPRRLERYLTICWESGATPVVVLTKADLCSNIAEKLLEVEVVAMGVDVLAISATEQGGADQLLRHIEQGQTAALIGSSGVGKSTLINCLLKENRIDTNGLRNDDKGRHTTTRRELFLLPNGGLVVDTPGMRELGMWNATDGFDKTFSDIEKLSSQCRFKDCRHTNEPGCAVRDAIENGTLPSKRFESYQKLQREAAYAGLNARQLENEKINRMFGSKGEMKQFLKQVKDKNKQV